MKRSLLLSSVFALTLTPAAFAQASGEDQSSETQNNEAAAEQSAKTGQETNRQAGKDRGEMAATGGQDRRADAERSSSGKQGQSEEASEDLFTDDHDYVDAKVRSSDGQSLGTVERVRFASQDRSAIDAFVIETGGFAEIGGREIMISANETEWTRRETDEGEDTSEDETSSEANAYGRNGDQTRDRSENANERGMTQSDGARQSRQGQDDSGNGAQAGNRSNDAQSDDDDAETGEEASADMTAGADANVRRQSDNERGAGNRSGDMASNRDERDGEREGEILTLGYTAQQVASLPTFDEDRASDYWLSDNPLGEDDGSQGETTQTASAADAEQPADIPAVSTEVFKHTELHCGGPIDRVFRTSGTTRERRGEHHFPTLDVYRASIRPPFLRWALPDLKALAGDSIGRVEEIG